MVDHDVLRPSVIDVFCGGTVFFDVVLTGLEQLPALGTEVRAAGMGSSPGGIANLAVAAARLGLRTSVAATFGTDAYGDYCWDLLSAQEGVDLGPSRRSSRWHSPVTVSLVVGGERTMITHAHDEVPVPCDVAQQGPPRARAYASHLGTDDPAWLEGAARSGGLVVADVGWELSAGQRRHTLSLLRHCDVFLPNRDEALALTGARTVADALKALQRHVPVVVVTCGADGVVAADRTTGETAATAALPVDAIDSTGAGDVFGAAFVLGTLSGWPLLQRVRFANLCAALSVEQFGGALAAPGWRDIDTWWRLRAPLADPQLRRDYRFVADLLPTTTPPPVGRAAATLAGRRV